MEQSNAELQRARQELANLTRRTVAVSVPDGTQSGEGAIPPLGESDGGPATEEELEWFRKNYPGRTVGEADGPIRVRRQWRNFWGADAEKHGW
jgi:hypothetical protein